MNKTETKEKKEYESPLVIDLGPVTVVRGDTTSGPEDPEKDYD